MPPFCSGCSTYHQLGALCRPAPTVPLIETEPPPDPCSICDSNDPDSCGCCHECDSTEDDCDCCSICHSTADDCDHCDRCEQPNSNCDCCSICESTSDACDHCDNCERPSENCCCCSCCGSSDSENCGCFYCDGCDETTNRDRCDECDECIDHCNCSSEFECENCDEDAEDLFHFHRPCNRCLDCCVCSTEETMPEPISEVTEGCSPERPAVVPCASCGGMTLRTAVCEYHRELYGRNYCKTCCQCGDCGHNGRGRCANCQKCIRASGSSRKCCECPRCTYCDVQGSQICEICARCINCCRCSRCNRHATFANHRSHLFTDEHVKCSSCGNCSEACTCPRCPTCSTRGGGCPQCSQCQTCCAGSQCGAMERDGQVILMAKRDLRFYSPANALQRKRNPSAREISVELETNQRGNKKKGAKLHAALVKWSDSVVPDGSIGDGHEINTSPSGGDLFLDHISDLCEGFKDLKLDANEKCGMHVHVNCKDITYYDLRKVILLYDRVERALFDACHPRRLNYQYSLRCGDFFSKNVAEVNPRGFKQSIYGQLYNNGRKLTRGIDDTQGTGLRWDAYYSSRQCRGSGCAANPSRRVEVNENYICRECFSNRRRGWQMAHADSYHCEAEGCPTGIRRVPVNHSLICEHCYKSVSIKHNQLVQKGERIKAAVGNKSHNLRYKALNMHSYFHRGSIEFRHHEGTTDYETIVGFARICAALIDAVNRLPEKAILALPKNSRKAMLAVLPPDLAEYIGKAWSRNDAIRNGPEGHQYRNMYQQVWGL